ncbi:GNAT family N-acetyltransferase [Paenibacillus wulumuqiensis]|uniref:GNAT family N-acetyltransferase n=1 Tax=Paenibacillus wulumuqiensis TaxID=1567107 RepID=UPI0009E53F24|nr:GNAT family N-acetyltransferase [Paenibacillus wulumuqiensis]
MMKDGHRDNHMIRPARPGDEYGIARVHVSSWQTTYAGMMDAEFLQQLSVTQREEGWARSLGEPESRRYILVLEQQGEITGFISGGANRQRVVHHLYDAEIYALYLLQSAQSNGYGRELLQHMARLLYEGGYRAAIIEALKDNPAVDFYRHLGAMPLSEQTIRVGGRLHREVTLGWKDLNVLLP